MRNHKIVVNSSKIIVQGGGTIMIPVGEIPVLIGPDEGNFGPAWMEVMAMAINFLKCGCPAVTIWSSEIARYTDSDDIEEWVSRFRTHLSTLLPGDPYRFLVDPLHNIDSSMGAICVYRRAND